MPLTFVHYRSNVLSKSYLLRIQSHLCNKLVIKFWLNSSHCHEPAIARLVSVVEMRPAI